MFEYIKDLFDKTKPTRYFWMLYSHNDILILKQSTLYKDSELDIIEDNGVAEEFPEITLKAVDSIDSFTDILTKVVTTIPKKIWTPAGFDIARFYTVAFIAGDKETNKFMLKAMKKGFIALDDLNECKELAIAWEQYKAISNRGSVIFFTFESFRPPAEGRKKR